MKKLVSLLMVMVMVLGLVACGGAGGAGGSKLVQECDAGDAHIKIVKAETRDPYGNGDNLVVYYELTNNSDEEKAPNIMCYFPNAKLGDTKVTAIDFLPDVAPAEQGKEYQNVAPGETVLLCISYGISDATGDIFTLTVQDSYSEKDPIDLQIDMNEVTEFVYE